MAERATVLQKYQIGVEAIPGTSVPADHVLPTLEFNYVPKAEIDLFKPTGWKFPSAVYLNREWSEGEISGKPCYNALTYILSGVLQNVTPTQPDPTNAPSVYQWDMVPALSAEDTVATFTIERGSAVHADRISYVFIPSFTFSASRSETEVGGSIIGAQFEDGITMTSGATEVAPVPVLPAHIDVFLDDTFSSIGTTKLLRLLSLEFEISDRFAPVWVLDSSQSTWATKVEIAPKVTMTLRMEADAAGMSPLAKMRAGDTAYIRLQATGPLIESTFNYQWTLDMAAKVSEEPGGLEDEDGVFAVEWTFHAVYDDTAGFALKSSIVNTLSAL